MLIVWIEKDRVEVLLIKTATNAKRGLTWSQLIHPFFFVLYKARTIFKCLLLAPLIRCSLIRFQISRRQAKTVRSEPKKGQLKYFRSKGSGREKEFPISAP